MDAISDFVRGRQINLALAALLLLSWLCYQFRGLVLKCHPGGTDLLEPKMRSRSRTRSRSPSGERRANSRRRRERCFCPSCNGDKE